MKRVTLVALLILAVVAVKAQDAKKLTILHTNDFHSHLQGFAPESAYTPLVTDNIPPVGDWPA